MPSAFIISKHGSREPCVDTPHNLVAAAVDGVVDTVPLQVTPLLASYAVTAMAIDGHMPVSPLRLSKSVVYFHRPRPPPSTGKHSAETLYMHVHNSQSFEVKPSGHTFAFPLLSPQRILPSPSTGNPSSPVAPPDSPLLATIGVALGSPSHSPNVESSCRPFSDNQPMASTPAPSRAPSACPRRIDSRNSSIASRQTADKERTSSYNDLPRQSRKPSWMSFAFLKSKTKPLPPNPPLSAVKEAFLTSPRPKAAASGMRFDSSASSLQRRLVPRGLARFEARMEAECAVIQNTIHNRARQPLELTVQSSDGTIGPSGLAIAINSSPGLATRVDGGNTRVCPGRSNAASPRVELEIPDARMERYSVMFEQVLQPQSTLAERRRHRKSLTLNTNFDHLTEPAKEQGHVRSPYRTSMPSLPTTIDSLYIAHNASRNEIRERSQESGQRSVTGSTCERNQRNQNVSDFCRPRSQPTLASQDGSPDSPSCDNDSMPSTPGTLDTTIGSIVTESVDRLEVVKQPKALSSPPVEQRGLYRSIPTFEEQMVEVSVARQVSINRAREIVNEAMVTGRQPLQKPKVVQLGHHRHMAKKSHTALVVDDGDKS